jgi:CcmD family protein
MDAIGDFFTHQSIYIVLCVVLAVWTGVYFYISRLDNKLSRLEKQFNETLSKRN